MKAVHFGAGTIGRGFIGELLHESGYEITLVDVSEALVNQINETNSYDLYLINHDYQKKTINNVQAVSSILQPEIVIQELAEASIITTSVWAENLTKIAPLLLQGLLQRQATNQPRVTILACENAFLNSDILKTEIIKADRNNELIDVEALATFPNTAVDRMVLDEEIAGKQVVAIGDDFELVIESNKLVDTKSKPIKNATYTENLQKFLERKLYIINCGHAWAGYVGYVLGYDIIQDVFHREELVTDIRQAMMESAVLLSKKYEFTMQELEEYVDFAIRRYQTPGVEDTINRVSRSPIRKLDPKDRLVGPALQCEEYGLPNEYLLKGIAAAFLFFNEEDEQSVRMHAFIAENGIEKAIKEYTSITDASPLFDKIVKFYTDQKQVLDQTRENMEKGRIQT